METINYKNYQIRIHHDDCPQDPMDMSDEKIISYHRNYGTDHGFTDREDLFEHAKNTNQILYPIHAYIHGGISLSLGTSSCPWDSGLYGYLLIDPAKWSKKRKCPTIDKAAEAILKVYNQYAEGECYWYEIIDKDGEQVNTLSGFYGSEHEESGLLDEARSHIDWEIRKSLKQHLLKVKAWILNKVNFQYRKPSTQILY